MEEKQLHLFEHPLERSSGAVPEWNLGDVFGLPWTNKGAPVRTGLSQIRSAPSKNRNYNYNNRYEIKNTFWKVIVGRRE